MSFGIHPGTAAAIDRLSPTLCAVSEERKREEIARLLIGPGAAAVMSAHPRALRDAWPEVTVDAFVRAADAFASLPPELSLRLAVLLSDLSPALRETALRTKRFDSAKIRRVLALGAAADAPVEDRADELRLLGAYSPDVCADSFLLRHALGRIDRTQADAGAARLRALAAGHPCCRLSDLAVGGDDLRPLGLRGPEIGAALRSLLEAVISGECDNTPAALLAYLSDHPL